ncbi:fungal-specific transcription factor domain-containing protein [Aspergillus spectabilis]
MARSCGTCRDRRISCDRAVPNCTQCTRANRACKGYGVRLSWPRANDARRAVVGRPVRGRHAVRQGSNAHMVNASTWDIVMHQYLLGLLLDDYSQLIFPLHMPFNPRTFDDGDAQLLQYFQQTASQSLAILGHEPMTLGGILMRMALTSNTPSAVAVRRALLGLSSLHRYGLQGQAMDFKIASIRALAFASTNEISTAEAIQHVAAGMLLCSIEIHKTSCTTGQWRWYVAGVKRVIAASGLGKGSPDGDLRALLDWVQYHDALSRFSSLHWRCDLEPTPFPTEMATQIWCMHAAFVREHVDDPTPMLQSTPSLWGGLLTLLTEGCEILSAKENRAPTATQTKYDQRLRELISELRALPIATASTDDKNSTLELFHLAALVYLNRASGNPQPVETEACISRAFTIFSSLDSCDRQFSLMILGCEARSDDERCMILDLISRTEKRASSRALYLTTIVIKRIWMQNDLAQGNLDYMHTLNGIMGACGILPPFV